MRRSLVLSIAVLAGAAAVAPLSLAAAAPAPSTSLAASSATTQERYGIVRYDAAARRWAILSGPGFQSSGLTGVSCASGNGVLTVRFAPLTTIGTFTVDEDEAYAGRYAAGASPTRDSLAITFRKAATGAVVRCDAAELRVANSSLQLWVRGTLVAAPTPTPPKPSSSMTKPPTTPPTPSSPPQSPSPSMPQSPTPTLTPPPIPSESDPADTDPGDVG